MMQYLKNTVQFQGIIDGVAERLNVIVGTWTRQRRFYDSKLEVYRLKSR